LVNVFVDEAGDGALFHTSDGAAYADFIIDGHRETWPVRSKQFRYAYMRYLRRQVDRLIDEGSVLALLMKSCMSKAAVSAAIDEFETRAICSSITRDVRVRVAGHGDIYIDLGTDSWEAVRVTGAGWSIVASPPVRFQRTAGMRPLPFPERDGKIEALRPFLNTSASDFTLIIAFLLAALYPRGPYLILILYGEHGTAKTHLLRRMRSLTDPHKVATSGLPLSIRDLFIAARNTHLQTFENVSKLSDTMSDALCRLATGGGLRFANAVQGYGRDVIRRSTSDCSRGH
jgi:hypothetical protein